MNENRASEGNPHSKPLRGARKVGALFSILIVFVAARFSVLGQAPGMLDTSFNPGLGANGPVNVVLVQADGKIFIGGQFSSVNGVSRSCVARLNSDGSLDTTFNPGIGVSGDFPPYLGIATFVSTAAFQYDDRITIAGSFSNYNGSAVYGWARILTNGIFDPTLKINSIAFVNDVQTTVDRGILAATDRMNGDIAWHLREDGGVVSKVNFSPEDSNGPLWGTTIASQSDGKIILGGRFQTADLIRPSGAARLNADFTWDTNFVSAVANLRGIAIQPDGKIIAATYSQVCRLQSDGSLDPTFVPISLANRLDGKISVQIDSVGAILVAGAFTSIGGNSAANLARLDATGGIDLGFLGIARTDGAVYSMARQKDGKVLIAGAFTGVNGTSRNRIARLYTAPRSDLPTSVQLLPIEQRLALGAAMRIDSPVPSQPGYRYQWQHDGQNIRGATNSTLIISAVQYQDSGQYQVTVSDFSNSITSSPAAVMVMRPTESSSDNFLNPNLMFYGYILYNPSPFGGSYMNPKLYSVAALADGKILVAGNFTNISGINIRGVARLNSDGTLDSSFQAPLSIFGPDSQHVSAAPIPGGRTMIWGNFLADDAGTKSIAVLNSDGTVDGSFNFSSLSQGGIVAVKFQSTGKLIVGTLNSGVMRLNSDGSSDASFTKPSVDGVGTAQAVLVAVNDEIMIGGNQLVRLAPDGAVDSNFKAPTKIVDPVILLGAYKDKIVVVTQGTSATVMRLNRDGSMDTGFAPSSGAALATALVVQSDGKVIIGMKWPGTWFGQARNGGPMRINADGSLDPSFRADADVRDGDPAAHGMFATINSMDVDTEGRLLVAGDFKTYNSEPHNYLVRIYAQIPKARIYSPMFAADGLRMYLPTETNVVYRLESASIITSSNWITSLTVTGDGSAIRLKGTLPSTPQQYYRIAIP